MNVTASTPVVVLLPTEGWYTICMTGPISKTSGGATSMRVGLSSVVNGTRVLPERADLWVDFKLYQEGRQILFGVWERG